MQLLNDLNTYPRLVTYPEIFLTLSHCKQHVICKFIPHFNKMAAQLCTIGSDIN